MSKARKAKARPIPKLGRHSSGQARVTLNGKVHYCGRWGTAEAHARYAEHIREWQERGERPADRAPNPEQATVLLGDLRQQFLHHVDATGRYRKNGEPTAQRAEFVNVINSLTAFAGKLPVPRMTEATLVAWRDVLERNRSLTRTGINRKVGKIVQILRWGRARGPCAPEPGNAPRPGRFPIFLARFGAVLRGLRWRGHKVRPLTRQGNTKDPHHLPARLFASSFALAATLCAQGPFSARQEITTTCYAAKDTQAADLDGDGALDVLAAYYFGYTVAWFENHRGIGAGGWAAVAGGAALG